MAQFVLDQSSVAKASQMQHPTNIQMEWTTAHNVMLCREVLVVDPFQAKKKTTNRAQLWQTIAANLKKVESPKFKPALTKRSVQDRCSLLCEKYKRRMAYEKRATGISPEVTELDQLVEEIIEKEELREETRNNESEEKKKKTEEDKETAVQMRMKAMERLSETKKRQGTEEKKEGSTKKRRRSSDTIDYLREKSQMDAAMKERELEMMKEKQEKEKTQHDDLLKIIAQQQQQQQQQNQQMQMMMAQQNNLMMAMIEKLSSSK